MYPGTRDRLTALGHLGTDPGSLSADTYVPKDLPMNSPLFVVLHCSAQSPENYDLGSGWSTLADECGMALLFPEQRKTNNCHWQLQLVEAWRQPPGRRRTALYIEQDGAGSHFNNQFLSCRVGS